MFNLDQHLDYNLSSGIKNVVRELVTPELGIVNIKIGKSKFEEKKIVTMPHEKVLFEFRVKSNKHHKIYILTFVRNLSTK